jgi:large subunit ribosomal protein LX
MKAYKVAGNFEMGWMKEQAFVLEIAAETAERARETVYSEIGSKHKVRRRQIRIEKIDEIPVDTVKNLIVKHKAGGKDEK